MNINTIDNLVDEFYQNKTSSGSIQIPELCNLKEKIIKENVDKIINEQSRFEILVNSNENDIYLYKSIHDNKLYVIYSEQQKIMHIEPISMEKLVKTQEEKNKETADAFVKKMVDANYSYMDNNNKKAAHVLLNDGVDKAVEFMFKHPETGQTMDYASMRYYYG